MKFQSAALALAFSASAIAFPAHGAKREAPELVKCDESIGTIALVEGSQAGWNDWKLGSPRALINALAAESGCFTPHNINDGTPARFLVTAIAGDKEEVDRGVEMAKAGASEALLRSGAAGQVLSKVPMGGALLGAFSAFGGKKRTVAAGLTVVSPANGMTLAVGSGSVKRSSLSFSRRGNTWASGVASTAGYQSSKNGKMLTEAYVLAFNELVAQKAALTAAPATMQPQTAASVTAVGTIMRAGPSGDAAEVRSLRAGTELTPTGERDGLFIEVADNYGTKGWVSVEDME